MGWFPKRLSEEALKLRARNEYNSKKYSKAEKTLLKLKKVAKNQSWANDVLARLYMNTERHEKAIPLWHQIYQSSDNPHRELQYLIDCYRVTKKFTEAISLLLESKLLFENEEMTWQKIQILLENIEDTTIIENFVKSTEEIGADNLNLNLVRLRLAQMKEDYCDIALQTSNILKMNESLNISPKTALKLANTLAKSGSYNNALLVLNTLELSEEVVRQKVDNLRKMGKYKQAIETFELGYKQFHTSEKFIISGIRLEWDIGNMNSVQNLSKQILQRSPDNNTATRFSLQSLVKLGNLEDLKKGIKSALKFNPKNIDAYNMAINLAIEEDSDYEKAIKLCDKILELEPNNRQALTKKVLALGKLGISEEMIEASDFAQSILNDDDEVTLTSAQAEWQVNSGKHIDLVNSMLERHGMTTISSDDHNNSLAIEYIQCEAESMSSHNEMVSVIMTVYGKDKYLDVAINSILYQTHNNLELIIVDDLSPDDAWKYLQELSKKDSRIKLLQVEKNGGTYLAKNLGLTKAKGDYIAFMDSDDWTHPQRIERQITALKSKPNSKAVWHKYFRIDETGNIIFRGKGALRNACISLLCKKEVFEQIGFFDSLRVGADTEFVERIQAYFGKDALIEESIPSMFMLQHSSSLTGGGKFHISWRSITDYRLAHHSSFREWHRKISSEGKSPYVPRILRIRPFNAPEEMLAGDSLWSEGMKMFGEEIQKRNHDWWKGKKPMWQKHLSEKIRGEEFVLERNIPIVPKFFTTESYDDPRFKDLPDRYVIKTSVGYSANQVFPVKDGKNVFTEEEISVNEILNKLQSDSFVQNQNHTIIVEELVEDEFGYKIPLDYKFFMFGEEIASILVIDRSSTVKKEQTQCFYDENWKHIEIDIRPTLYEEDKFSKPKFFDEMSTAAKQLGQELGIFMRIDFYTTENGFYFGEFTPTPDGGKGYSDEGNKFLGTFWKGEEGALGS